jgi:NAD(P)-dependent dehydrogenase (short-subunit alcohol dehydrogenase family)
MHVAVTGAGNGIGRAIAQHFARTAARVAIADIDAASATATAESIGSLATATALDVTDRDAFAAFLDAAEAAHGPIDVLVNNAGVDWVGPFHEEPDEVTRHEVNVNVLGVVYGTPRLLAQITPDDVASAVVKAVEHDRFEVWVPSSQGVSAKLSAVLPRRAREPILRGLGVGEIAGGYDRAARSGYHVRMFGRS